MFSRLERLLNDFDAGWYSERAVSFLLVLHTLDYLETRSFGG